MTNIRILECTRTQETSTPDSDDKWDRADTSTSHDIKGFEISEKYFDLTIDFTPEYGIVYFLLYGVYSSGDSFGHDAGYGIEFLGLYEKHKTADLNLKRVEALTVGTRPAPRVTLLTDFGIDYEIYVPWFGYFERLDYLRIEQVFRQL